jgi:hypothetical protein
MGTLPASPPISLSQIRAEFGDPTNGPHNLAQYIKGNGPSFQVQDTNYAGAGDDAPNVPTALPISILQFRSAHKRFPYAASLPSAVTTAYTSNVVIAVTAEEECIIYVEEGTPASAPTSWAALATRVMGSHTGSEPFPYIITTDITLTGVASGLHAYRVKLEYPNHAETVSALPGSNTCTVSKQIIAPDINVPAATMYTHRPTFTGTGVVGATVTLRINYGGTFFGDFYGTVDGSGNWSITVTSDMAHATTYTLVAMQTLGGVGSAYNPTSRSTYIDLTPAAPSLSVTNAGGTPVADGSLINYLPYFKGVAEAGATVYIQHAYGGGAITSTTADGSGNYFVQMTAHADGGYAVEAYQNNGHANSGTSGVITFTKDMVAPSAPSITAPTGTRTQTFNVTVTPPEANCIIRLYRSANGSTGWALVATTARQSGGPTAIAISYTAPANPSENYFYATAEDAATNVGSACATTANFHVGASAITATLNSYYNYTQYTTTGLKNSGTITCSGGGGNGGPYTYAWAWKSGNVTTILTPTAAATLFRTTLTSLAEVRTGYFTCTVSDGVNTPVESAQAQIDIEKA